VYLIDIEKIKKQSEELQKQLVKAEELKKMMQVDELKEGKGEVTEKHLFEMIRKFREITEIKEEDLE
jgi:hypothetical protein